MAGGGLIILAWFVLVAVPQWKVIAATGPQVFELQQNVRETKQGLEHLGALSRQYEQLRAELNACPRQLVQERVPALLDELAALATANGMAVDTVRPVEVKVPKRANKKGEAEASSTEHAVIPIEILGRAGYHDLGRFVEALENAQQIYRIEAMTIDTDRRDFEHHRITVRVNAHVAVTAL